MITERKYEGQNDYWAVSAFLKRHHREGNLDGNWLEPIWEYMHGHPMLDEPALDKIRIWEAGGEIVAVANYETSPGEAFFQFHPGYRHLREEMLDYAEQNLYGVSEEDGRRYLNAYVNDYDKEFQTLVQGRGYQKKEDWKRPLYRFDITDPFPEITLPEGYCLKSLADEPDWGKVHKVMWQGFNHGPVGEITDEDREERRKMFETVNARLDLKIVAAAPNGDFGAICGMFYDAENHYGYVEPVATDPEYRRMGLGKAAVLEGIRRCGALGATVAYVGSDQAFYQAIGFRKVFDEECWQKYF
jgi:ribosomal protein S18 acetylase RimI-like enzyme